MEMPLKDTGSVEMYTVFDEASLGFEKEQQKNLSQPINVSTEVESHDEAKETDEQALGDHENKTHSDEESPVIPRHSERTRQSLDFYGVHTYMTKDQVREPMTVSEALSSSEKEKWIGVMEKRCTLLKQIRFGS